MLAETHADEPRDPARQVADAPASGMEETLDLREEQLVAHTELLEIGEITVRTEFDDVPGRLEVDACREEIVIEHEPVGQVVSERDQPSEKNGVLVMAVYEEQLVVVKRLVLKERLHIRRVATTERQLFEETLRRERLVIEDPQRTGRIHEQYPTGEQAGEWSDPGSPSAGDSSEGGDKVEGGVLENLVRKALG
jgi:uncharacterized protein (TIGR02271 family)